MNAGLLWNRKPKSSPPVPSIACGLGSATWRSRILATACVAARNRTIQPLIRVSQVTSVLFATRLRTTRQVAVRARR